jgi:hypothetical protein
MLTIIKAWRRNGVIGMKPLSKNDSWRYTASKRPAREKVRRLTSKRRRRENEKFIKREASSLPHEYGCFISPRDFVGGITRIDLTMEGL